MNHRFFQIPTAFFAIASAPLWVFSQSQSDEEGFEVQTIIPDWVQIPPTDWTNSPEETEDSGAVYFHLIESQFDLSSKTQFYRYAKEFNTESGVQDDSQLELSYDPSYQTLSFHILRIHRDGETIDRLESQDFKIAQREEDHERQAYDSRLSVLALLEDVRKGDVLEYAYSITGSNPVFEGESYWTQTFGYTTSVGMVRGRVRVPADREITTRSHEFEIPLTKATDHDDPQFTIYEWVREDPPSLVNEGSLPIDYDPWAWVEVTTYESWEEVGDWAQAKYETPEELPEALVKKIDEIKSLPTKPEQVTAALRFAQDEIRYLGLFEGIHTHQPYPIETILRRRFGDCKDKSLLLTTMLRSLGFNAFPALVSTDYRAAIKSWLPSPYAFDHLVVFVEWEGKEYWLDPTRSHQRGSLDDLFFPDLGYSLVIRPGETGLTAVTPGGYDICSTEVLEEYFIPDYSGPATLKVKTIYRGLDADIIRSEIASTSKTKMARGYVNFYGERHDKVESMESLDIVDDEVANVITVKEAYSIPQVWAAETDDSKRLTIEFPSEYVVGEIMIPSTKNRTMPYAITVPEDIQHDIKIQMPTAMVEEDSELNILDDAFSFQFFEKFEGKLTHLRYAYKTLDDRVAPERIEDYLKNARRAENNTNYELWITRDLHEGKVSSSPVDTPFLINWSIVAVVCFSLIVSAFISRRIYRWDPKPSSPTGDLDHLKGLKGIGGWLGLAAVGIIIRPIMGLVIIGTVIYNNDLKTWQSLTTPGEEQYHVLWEPSLLLEAILYPAFFPIEITLMILFFKTRTSLPRLLIAYFVVLASAEWLMFGLFSAIPMVDPEALEEYLESAIKVTFMGLIWGSYFHLSKRVTLTFINQLRPTPPPLPETTTDRALPAPPGEE